MAGELIDTVVRGDSLFMELDEPYGENELTVSIENKGVPFLLSVVCESDVDSPWNSVQTSFDAGWFLDVEPATYVRKPPETGCGRIESAMTFNSSFYFSFVSTNVVSRCLL
jgi:hypothetical protein